MQLYFENLATLLQMFTKQPITTSTQANIVALMIEPRVWWYELYLIDYQHFVKYDYTKGVIMPSCTSIDRRK